MNTRLKVLGDEYQERCILTWCWWRAEFLGSLKTEVEFPDPSIVI